jgi:hypothetical protein
MGLLGGRRVRGVQEHRVDERRVEPSGAFTAARLRAIHDRPLVVEQLGRGKAPLSETAGTVHVVAPQEFCCGSLDRRRRCPLHMGGGPRHHDVAPGERVLPLGEPARSNQLTAHPPRIGDLGRPGRSEHQRGELGGAESVLGRPGAHHVAPRGGVDPVPLAPARVVSDRLTPAIRHLHARGDELAFALLDLTTTRGELPQRRRRELLDLRHPIPHEAPAHPRQTLMHRPAKVGLVEEPGRLRVLVYRRGIKRRPAPVGSARQVRRDHMGVQLWILGAAHPMAIGRRHEPLPHLTPHPAAAATHPTRLTLQIAHGSIHRRLMRLDQRAGQRRLPDREQHAHRLRRRERQVKRRHLRAPTDALEALARSRVTTVHQRHEAVVVNPAAEPDGLRPATGPATRRLAAAGVVVIAALRDLALVIARLLDRQLADRQHRRVPSSGSAAQRDGSPIGVPSGVQQPHTATKYR